MEILKEKEFIDRYMNVKGVMFVVINKTYLSLMTMTFPVLYEKTSSQSLPLIILDLNPKLKNGFYSLL